MNKKLNNIQEIFFSTNKQKVLKFLAQNPNHFLMISEIIKNAKISKAGANIALRGLVKAGLIKRIVKGKTHLFQVDFRNSLIKQFKLIENIVELYPLIKKLKDLSQQVILFGSASRGENLKDSDIDLFVLTRAEEETRKAIRKFNWHGRIKAIVKNPSSFSKLEKGDPTFYQEVERGIILWEEYE